MNTQIIQAELTAAQREYRDAIASGDPAWFTAALERYGVAADAAQAEAGDLEAGR